MRIGVFSDCHREIGPLLRALQAEPVDYLIGLGDYVGDGEDVAEALGLPILQVRGNGDWASSAPSRRLVTFGDSRLYLCHGHEEGVKSGLLTLSYQAMEADADLALFGHTHQALDVEMGGVRLLNPGSAGRPRCGEAASYLVLDLGQEGLSVALKTLA